MSFPKFLLLDQDLLVVGMASNIESCEEVARSNGGEVAIYKLHVPVAKSSEFIELEKKISKSFKGRIAGE